MKKSIIFSFTYIGQIGFATAIPLVVCGYFGRYLDRRYDSSPYFLLAGIALATVQVFFYLRAIVKRTQQKIEELNGN